MAVLAEFYSVFDCWHYTYYRSGHVNDATAIADKFLADIQKFFCDGAGGAVAGILSTLLAVSVLIKLAVVIMAVIYLTAFLSVCAGVFCIVFSIRLRRIKLKKVNE
jgi:hypothetical protein